MKNSRLLATAGLFVLAVMVAGCVSSGGSQKDGRWWKGITHMHSTWSDGRSYPEVVATWYKERGYNFAVVTDHNTIQKGEKWKRVRNIESNAEMKEYLAAFDKEWVKVKGEGSNGEVLCRPLSDYRDKVAEPGKFILIRGEEITCKNGGRQVHVIGVNVAEQIPAKAGKNPVATFEMSIKSVSAQAAKIGRPMAAILCHPGWGNGPTVEEVWPSREVRLFEVVNGGPQYDWNLGNKRLLSTDRWWDVVLTKRIEAGIITPLYGIAADDTHRLKSDAGHSWIMVKSRRLEPDMIVSAINRGDFYSTTGVLLDDIGVHDGAVSVKVRPEKGVSYTIQFIGTRNGYDTSKEALKDDKGKLLPPTERYSKDIGVVLKESKGLDAVYELTGDELYVRVKVVSSKMLPAIKGRTAAQSAWTQVVAGRGTE